MTDFHPPAITANLIALASSSSSAPVLRIQRDLFARELSKSQHVACTYCREWATNVYKHFYLPSPSSSKALHQSKEKVFPQSSTNKEKIPCKDYMPHVWESIAGATQKDNAAKACKALRTLNSSPQVSLLREVYNEVNENSDSEEHGAFSQTVQDALDAIDSWRSHTPHGKQLPDFIGPVIVSEEEVPFPNPATGSPNPLELLSAVNWDDRGYLCLPSSAYPLLKTVTKAAINAQTTRTCHPRPKWRTPTEEKMARAAISGEIERNGRDAQEDIEGFLAEVWGPLCSVLNRLRAQNKVRELVLGPKASATMMQTLEDRHASDLLGFSMYEKYKKEGKGKKGPKVDLSVEELDKEFTRCIQGPAHVSSVLVEEFLVPLANEALAIAEDTQTHLLSIIKERKQMSNYGGSSLPDDAKQKIDFLFESVVMSLNELVVLTEKQKKELASELLGRITEMGIELDGIISSYLDESQPTVAGRMGKIANPAFRKRIRRFENSHAALRQWFHSNCSKRLLPAKALAVSALPLIDMLMRNGERIEVSILRELLLPGTELWEILHMAETKRAIAALEFSDGINKGRTELSVFVARQFLQEADRLIQESRAIKRQSTLLKQINPDSAVNSSASAGSKKKKKEEKQANSSDSLPVTLDSVNDVSTAKAKRKAKKKKSQPTDELDAQMDAEAGTEAEPTLADNLAYAAENASNRDASRNQQRPPAQKQRKALEMEGREKEKKQQPSTSFHKKTSNNDSTVPTYPTSESEHAERQSNDAVADPNSSLCHIDALPADLDSFPRSRLIPIIRSLHEDKNNLIMTLVDMSKQVSSLSTRYAELLDLVRKMEEERSWRDQTGERGMTGSTQGRHAQEGERGWGQRFDDDRKVHIGNQGEDWENRTPSPVTATFSPTTTAAPLHRQQQQQSSVHAPPPGFLSTSSTSTSPAYPVVTATLPARQPRIPSAQGKGFRGARRGGGVYHEQQYQVRCDNCFEKGHASADCTNGCLNCGSGGHLTSHCRA